MTVCHVMLRDIVLSLLQAEVHDYDVIFSTKNKSQSKLTTSFILPPRFGVGKHGLCWKFPSHASRYWSVAIKNWITTGCLQFLACPECQMHSNNSYDLTQLISTAS